MPEASGERQNEKVIGSSRVVPFKIRTDVNRFAMGDLVSK